MGDRVLKEKRGSLPKRSGEMPVQYYIKRADNVQGPLTREQLFGFVKAKKISGSDLVGNSSKGPFQNLKSTWSSINKQDVHHAKPTIGSSTRVQSSIGKEFFYLAWGVPKGPFTWEQFFDLAKNGKIKANTSCILNDTPSRPAKEFFGKNWDQIQEIQGNAKAKIAQEKTLRIQEKEKNNEAKKIAVPPIPSAQVQESESKLNQNLISCPDCGSTVSKRANACPNCGSPIVLQQADVFVQEKRLIGHPMGSVQTTEQTGKKWKALMLIGAFVAFLSACVFGLGIAANDGGRIGSYSLVGMLLGICVFIHAKVGAWWNHG